MHNSGPDNSPVIYVFRDNGSSSKPSFLRIPGKDLELFLRTALIPIYEKALEPDLIFDNSTIHDFNNSAFWLDPNVMESPCKTIKLRPFYLKGKRGCVYIRFLQLQEDGKVLNTDRGPILWRGNKANLEICK